MFKQPISVLVVIYTADGQVLLLERADHPGYWQSVTGSVNANETLVQAAIREVFEETGIDASQFKLVSWGDQNVYEIYPEWRHRYAPGITHNTEHVFGLAVPAPLPITISDREHLNFDWMDSIEAAAQRVFSPSNASAIRKLPKCLGHD